LYGRDIEQRKFKELLVDLARTPKKPKSGWSHVLIVHGIGGIGKSTVASRFSGLASEDAGQGMCTVIKLDWATVRGLEPAEFGVQPGPSFESILNELERECSYSEIVSRHLAEFRRLRRRLADIDAKVDRAAAGLADPGLPHTALGLSAGVIASVLKAGEMVGVPPGLSELAQAAGVAADALPTLRKDFDSWLRARLGSDDYQLFAHRSDALASAFGRGLAAATSRRPVVLILDTYEIIAAAGPWLRVVTRGSGPRVVWVLCGRLAGSPIDWPSDLDLYSSERPGGRVNELSAFRKDVPGNRLHVFELGAFDVETLRGYLAEVAPERPADHDQLARLFAVTAGVPLAVRIAAYLWKRGLPIDVIADPVPISSDQRTVVTAMTERFLRHLNTEGSASPDLDKINGMALALYPDDVDLIAALWGTDHVVESFESLAQRHDFVLAGRFRLHDTVRAFLLRYLLEPFRRHQVRALNQRAVDLLERRLIRHHQHLPTLERRMSDARWVPDLLALVWHRFWVDQQSGWATLLAAFPAAIAYNPSAGRDLLELASRFVTSASADEQRRLRLLRDTVGPIAALFSRVGADALAELSSGSTSLSLAEPDAGRGDERLAIVNWLYGQYAVHNDDLDEALRRLTEAADHTPTSAARLRRWISRSLVSLSRSYPIRSIPRSDPEAAPAVVAVSLALRLEPDNPDAQHRWADILNFLRRHDEALSAYDAAIQLGEPSADVFIDRGEVLRALGRFEDAIHSVNEAVSLDPDDARAVASRGETYRLMGRQDEAMTDLNEATSHDPPPPSAFLSRGLVHLAQGDYRNALADIERAIDLDSEYVTAYVAAGHAYYYMGQYEDAVHAFDRAAALDPGDSNAIGSRGQVYLAMEDYEKALANLDEALSLEPERFSAMISRGEAYRLMGRYEEALADFTCAIGLDGNNAFAIGRRGQVHLYIGHFEEALADLNRAIELDPDLRWAHTDRGMTYRLMGRYEEALGDLERIIYLHPGLTEAVAERGRVYRDMGHFEEALADLTRAIELDPADTSTFASRGIVHYLRGCYQEAIADLNKAIDADPHLDWAIIARGETHYLMDHYEEALVDLRRAAELDPGNGWPNFKLAIGYLRLTEQDHADTELRQAIEKGSREVTDKGATLPRLFNLVLYYAVLGDIEQMRKLWDRATALPHAVTYLHSTALRDFREVQTIISDGAQLSGLASLFATLRADDEPGA